MKTNKEIPFYLLFIAAFFFMAGTQLFLDGMFVDGVVYAAVSKNLASGTGTFWTPFYTATLYSDFYEHPPLVFGLQSIFFSVFGNGLYVERIYSLITFFLTTFLILKLWQELNGSYQLGWLPLIFWISIPLLGWAVSNNMLENTLMVFVCLSALFYLKSLRSKKFLFLALAALSILAGFLSKGFVSLFTLSIPLFVWIAAKKISFSQFVGDTLIMLFILFVTSLLMFLVFPESYNSLIKYINKQVVGSLENGKTVESRFYILFRLFTELIPMLTLVIILLIIRWFKTRRALIPGIPSGESLLLILIGLSGVVPIIISMKQSGYYMLAAFPFFALGFAFLIRYEVRQIIQKVNYRSAGYKIFYGITLALFISALVFSLTHMQKTGRDQEKLHDIRLIIGEVPEKTTIALSYDLFEDWSLHAYFMRLADISLDPDNIKPYKYYITKSDECPDNFTPTDINTKHYKLCKKE